MRLRRIGITSRVEQRIGERVRDFRRWYRYERHLSVEAPLVRLAAVGAAGKDRVDHIPSAWDALGAVLRPSDVEPNEVFLDLGSGTGRVVVLAAARYPFRKVIGVEVSHALHGVAARNIELNRHRLSCHEVQLVNRDVINYQIPRDVTVAYMYNPFTGPLFDLVIGKLIQSVDEHPRRLRLVYYFPNERGRLLDTGRAKLIKSAFAGGDRSVQSEVNLYVLLAAPDA